jgi:glycosyltransferase involved in cell wall biosynthesis
MTEGLRHALLAAGHEVEVVTMPFRFGPPSAVAACMKAWQEQDFSFFDAGRVDKVIALKFPAIYLRHPDKRVWLAHQHRSVYELWDTPFGEQSSHPEALKLRADILRQDTESLRQARCVFTISPTVSERLLRFNGLASEPLLQPPPEAERFEDLVPLPYVFVPSRLEQLKRQDLLIRAMQRVKAPLVAVIAGDGGQRHAYESLARERGLDRRVLFLGRIDADALRRWYAQAFAVFFAPLQEDYGFITLEAMLSARPVITCHDGETGLVTDPTPESVAHAIDNLWSGRARARRMGRAGRAHYEAMNIKWDRVVSTLLAD